MIVRARAKSLEDVPPAMICCDMTASTITAVAGEIFQLDTATVSTKTLTCQGCGANHSTRVARIQTGTLGGRFGLACINCLDLDEGAL